MRLRSRLGRGLLIGCLLATLPAGAALAGSAPHVSSASVTVISTTASQLVGGLPASTLDGKIEYIPRGHATASASQSKASGLASPRDGASPATGYDISWPNCGGALPPSSSVAIVGVDGGHPFSQNPCFDQELSWAGTASHPGLYMVLDSPIGWTSPHVLQYAYHGPAGDCTATEYACLSFNWGYNAATNALQSANSQGATASQWWLDVELPASTSIDPSGPNCYAPNFWVCNPIYNWTVLQAATAVLTASGKHVGVYSTKTQWQSITNGMPFAGPIWIAGWNLPAATYCDLANADTYWFAYSAPALVQGMPTTFDPDTTCSSR